MQAAKTIILSAILVITGVSAAHASYFDQFIDPGTASWTRANFLPAKKLFCLFPYLSLIRPAVIGSAWGWLFSSTWRKKSSRQMI